MKRYKFKILSILLQMFDMGSLRHTTYIQSIVQFVPYTLQCVSIDIVNNSSNAFSELTQCCWQRWYVNLIFCNPKGKNRMVLDRETWEVTRTIPNLVQYLGQSNGEAVPRLNTDTPHYAIEAEHLVGI